MPGRRLHEPHASVGDLRGERSVEADGIHRIRLDGNDQARTVPKSDPREGAEVRPDIDDNVAIVDRDRPLLVDVANGLLEREEIELAPIPFGPPEPAEWRLP